MKKNISKILLISAVLLSGFVFSQSTPEAQKQTESDAALAEKKRIAAEEKARLPKPYHPEENAEKRLAEIVKQAGKEHKNIMIQAGGNWCIWCLRFNSFVQNTPELKALADENYVYYHLNYSPENKNEKIFARYGNPGEKFGYPVFIILDSNGKLIDIQESSVLEEGKGYSLEKTKAFFNKFK